jgi:uncharacterized Tic20 family protein
MVWRFVGLLIPVAIVVLPISFFLIKRSAQKRGPQQDGSALRFSIAPGMRFLIVSVVVALSVFSILTFAMGLIQGEGWYGVFIPLAVLLAIIMAIPRAVVLNDDGIRQHRWLLGSKEIAWNEIAWMRRGWRTGTTYVKSKKGGRPVSFSALLVGKSHFEREVRKHAPEAVEQGE